MSEQRPPGFWATLPGILTGLAGLLGSIASLIIILVTLISRKPIPIEPDLPIPPTPQASLTPTPTHRPTPHEEITKIARNIEFTIRDCVRAIEADDINIILCNFLIKSIDDDRTVYLYGYDIYGNTGDCHQSILYDDENNEIVAAEARIANKNTLWGAVEKYLVSNFPARAGLVFRGIDPDARVVSLLKICYSVINEDYSEYIEFRDIPISDIPLADMPFAE